MANRIQFRRDTLANWQAANPVLMEGELALVATDPSKPGVYDSKKVGDGVHAFNDLEMLGYECLQELGDSTQFPVSQKVTTDELSKLPTTGLFFDKIISVNAIKNVAWSTNIKVFAGISYCFEIISTSGQKIASFLRDSENNEYSLVSTTTNKKIKTFEKDTSIVTYGLNFAGNSVGDVDITVRISIGARADIENLLSNSKQINSDIENLESNVAILNKRLDNLFIDELCTKGYINVNGTIFKGGTTFILKEYIPVSEGESWHFKGNFTDTNLGFVWGYFDKEGSNAQMLVQCAIGVDKDFIIPEGVNYILAWTNSLGNDLLYKVNLDIENINSAIVSINSDIESLESNSFEKSIISRNLLNPATVINGYYVRYQNGELASLDNYSTSDYIKVKSNTNYVQNWPQQVAFYDANKEYLSGIANVERDIPFFSPDNASYIRICFPTSFKSDMKFCEGDTIVDDTYAAGFEDFFVKDSQIVINEPIIVTATRNEQDYNSIRELVSSLRADKQHPYIIFVPNGKWHECDLQGKEGVTIIGQDRDKTIIYNDGLSTNLSPADYSISQYANTPLNEIPKNQKHIAFVMKDIVCENITFEVNDAKYCVHLDHSHEHTAKFKGCRFFSKENVNFPIGIGIWGGQKIYFESCIFERTTTGNGIFAHNWNNRTKPTLLDIRNCVFITNGYMTVDELGSEQNDEWNLINCTCSSPFINWMVDLNSNGDTYYKVNGVNVSNPAEVPYCIKLNTLGSNVQRCISSKFSGNEKVISRPNFEKYMISENICIIRQELPIGSVYYDKPYHILGVVQNVIDGYSYVIKMGNYVCIPNSILNTPTGGTKIYANNYKSLTTTETGILIGTMVESVYDKDIILLV